MSAASDYLENKLLDHVLGNTTFAQPATLYLGLFTNDSTNASANLEAGTLSDEVSGGSYGRKVITFNVASGGSASNGTTVTFDTANADWGLVSHVAILDSVNGGEVLFWGPVAAAKTILNGDTFQVSSNNLTISLA